MAHMQPHAQLTGTWKLYLAPYGTAKPAINATPSGSWVEVGPTVDAQEIEYAGALTKFYDNDHQGPVKAVREQEDPAVRATVAGLTLENYGRILSDVSQVVTTAGSPDVKTLPIKRGFSPYEYALLLRGETDSPYGAYASQVYIPRCVQGSEPVESRAKGARAALEVEFSALEDDAQAEGYELGWREVAIEA